jgi:hypothetical protein
LAPKGFGNMRRCRGMTYHDGWARCRCLGTFTRSCIPEYKWPQWPNCAARQVPARRRHGDDVNTHQTRALTYFRCGCKAPVTCRRLILLAIVGFDALRHGARGVPLETPAFHSSISGLRLLVGFDCTESASEPKLHAESHVSPSHVSPRVAVGW